MLLYWSFPFFESQMDLTGFEAEVRAKRPPAPVVVFAGTEAVLRERGLALLRDSDPELAANLVRVHSSETDWARLMDELCTLPFLARRKLVVLVDEGNFVHNEPVPLRDYLKNPSPCAVLAVLIPTDKVPALGAGACVVECRALKGGELARWLAGEAQRLGKSLDRAAAELLASRAGGGLTALSGYLEQLASYAGARGTISADDVRALVGNHEERKVYELSLAAATRNVPKAFRVLRILMDAGEPVQVLVWKLAWEYRKLAEAKKLLLAGRKRFEVTSLLQITYFAEEFLRLVDAHPLAELVEKHGEILKADVAIKTSGGNEEAILESLVCRLASAGVSVR